VGYPTRPVALVVPGPVGGTTDTLCRLLADGLRGALGKPIVVENRPGAVGAIGAAFVATAQPDGHTLLCTPDAPIVLSPLVNRSLPYDSQAFAPVISLALTYSVVAVRRGLQANSIAELIARAKENPGTINYASGGNGSASHLAARQFACLAGIDMVNIPYPGSAPSQRALVGSEVDLVIDSLPVLLPAFRGGLIKIVAVGAPNRISEMPDVPTLAESGLGLEFLNWFGVFAPRGTPRLIVEVINRASNDVLAQPQTRARLDAMGIQPVGGTPADFAQFVARDRSGRVDSHGMATGRRCAAGFVRRD
jgi:tripartite-type tricarboxylate transporter receptor subunit TctC